MAAKKVPARKPATPKEKAPPVSIMRKVEELASLEYKLSVADAKLQPSRDKAVELREDLFALFGKAKLDGLKCKHGTFSIVATTYPDLEDKEALLRYAKLKGNADLLTVGLNSKAWRARLDAGKAVPGVKEGERKSLRFTPSKK